MSREVVMVCKPVRWHRLPLLDMAWLDDRPRDVCGRRRSRATFSSFRKGLKPHNAGRTRVVSGNAPGSLKSNHHVGCASNGRLRVASRYPQILRMSIPYGYCHCGCGAQTTIAPFDNPRYGAVKGEPRKYLRGHNHRQQIRYEIDADGCWIWQGAIGTAGYGRIQRDGVSHYAHRFMYERHVGTIPDGLQIDHLCRNRACVNPAHLEPVTRSENLARGFGPASVNRRKTHCTHGHEFTAENTYVDRRGRRHCVECRKAASRRFTEARRAA